MYIPNCQISRWKELRDDLHLSGAVFLYGRHRRRRTNNCGDTRTVSCNTGYTGTSTVITCNSTTKTWTGSGPVCTPACVPRTCASLDLCSGSTATSDGCSGTIYCGSGPGWYSNAANDKYMCSGTGQSCTTLCALYGLSSGFDLNGKTCRSDETCGASKDCGDGGNSGSCTGKGGSRMTWYTRCCNKSCSSGKYAFCYNAGQVHDEDCTDLVTACYCSCN